MVWTIPNSVKCLFLIHTPLPAFSLPFTLTHFSVLSTGYKPTHFSCTQYPHLLSTPLLSTLLNSHPIHWESVYISSSLSWVTPHTIHTFGPFSPSLSTSLMLLVCTALLDEPLFFLVVLSTYNALNAALLLVGLG